MTQTRLKTAGRAMGQRKRIFGRTQRVQHARKRQAIYNGDVEKTPPETQTQEAQVLAAVVEEVGPLDFQKEDKNDEVPIDEARPDG